MSHRIVAYQGGEGAFSHTCANRHFRTFTGTTRFVGYDAFRPMLVSVERGESDFAVLPIENTTAGSINESYDLLYELDLHIVGEQAQPVVHCLIGLANATVEGLTRIYSHPVALLQCRRLLSGLTQCRAEAYSDTALAVAKVKADGDPAHAAIASAEAAYIHGLPILASAVQDQTTNFTRMVIVAREPLPIQESERSKTSLVFAISHRGGALARAIAVFADHDINLTKLESRPKPESPWQYLFYLDFEGHTDSDEVKVALAAFEKETSMLRVFGSYAARTFDWGAQTI